MGPKESRFKIVSFAARIAHIGLGHVSLSDSTCLHTAMLAAARSISG